MIDRERHAGYAMGDAQPIPVNMYVTSSHDLVIMAPMPGLEPDDLDISVNERTLTISGKMRGPDQMDRQYITHEWTYGPYVRTLELPFPVDADHANASLGNGVLALSLPRSASSRPHRIELRKTAADRGRCEGHSGHHSSRKGLADED